MPPVPTSVQIKDLQLSYVISVLRGNTCQLRLLINSEQSTTTAWQSIPQDQETGTLKWKEQLLSDIRDKIQLSFEVYIGGVVRPKLLMKGSTEFSTSGKRTAHEVVNLMSIASFMRKGAKVDNCKITFTWKVITEDVRASIIATTPLLETVPAAVIPPSPSSEGSLNASSAEKVKQVSSFIEQGIVDMDDEDDDSEANESDSHGHASPKIPRPAHTTKPSQSQPTASVTPVSGGLHDHLHQIATAESFDDNESSATETASHLGSESGQSEDMHSVHEFDENDMQTWLVDQQHKLDEASPAAGAKLSAGIAASDSFSPQVASFYRNVGTESDDNTSKTPGDDATSLFLSNVEESDDDDDDYALKPLASASSAHTPSPSTKTASLPPSVVVSAAMKTPNTPAAAAAVAASDINPFLANVEDDDEDEEEEIDQMALHKSPFPSGNDLAPVATSSRLSSSSQSPKNSQQKVRFSGSLRSTSKEAPPPPQPVVAPASSNKGTASATTNPATAAVEKIESVIDSETEELIIHSVRRAQSFKTDTLDHVPPISPRSGRTSPLPPSSTSTSTSAATASVVAQPVTPVPIIKAKVEMDPLVSIELPTKEDVDDLFREVSEMRSHMEHEMKRNDAECKFLESQLQLLLDTPVTDGDTHAAQDMRQQYDHQCKRLHELEHLRMAEINQLQVKWLKIKEVGHLMHQEAVQARSLIFAEENKAKAFYNHYHHLKETIDQAHLHMVHMQREEELQAMYTWSEDVVNRLETLELFEKEFQKIRERYEGVTYFIPEFVLHLVKPVVAPPAPPPVAEAPTSPSPSLSPSSPSPPPRANAEMAVSAPLTPVPPPPPPPPPMDAPPVLTPKPTVSKTLSQRMSVFQPPAVSAANSSSSSTTTSSSSAASIGTETSSEATAASTSQGDKPVAVAKKRLKGELGALVNEVLVRRGSACPYGVPPKRHSESNGGEEGESLQSIADAAVVQSQPFLSVSIPSPPPPPPSSSSQSQQALPPKPAATSSALRSIFMSADDGGHHESTALDDSVDANRPSPWSTDTGLMTPMASDQAHMSFTPFSPIASGAERRGSETESIFTTDDRHTPVLDSSMSKLAQKRLSLSDRKKSRSSMSGMASPVPNHEAIRVVTSLTKSLKKKYTSDNLADLVAMSRTANGGNNGSDPTKNGNNSPDKQSPIKRDSLPKTPEKEELPELEGVLDLPEIPLSAVVNVSPKSADAHHHSSNSTTSSNNLKPFPPPPQPPAAGGVTTSATTATKTGAKALSLNTSHLTEDIPPTKLLSPAQKALLADISSTSSSSDDRNRVPPPPPPPSSSSSMGGVTAPMANTATKSTTDAPRALSPIPAVQPKLNFTKLDASGGARTVSPVFATKEEDLSADDSQPSTGKDNSIKNMKYFYQGVLDIVGDGIRSGVLRVFRIMELTLVSSSSSSSATSSAGGGVTGGGTSSSGTATPSGANEYKGEGNGPNGSGGNNNNNNKRRSSVANAGGTPSSNSGTPTAASLRNTLIQNALTQRRKAMNMGLPSSDSPSELSRSPSNDTLNGGGGSGTPSMVNGGGGGGGGERGRTMSRDSISPDKSMPKTHVSILPQLPFYDTKTLLDTLAQKNLQGDLQLKHHAMVMLSNTLHLNNIEDMLIHVRALNDAHAILTNNDTELISGKLWDISHLFQAARVLIHLFGTEAAHGRGSVSGTVADHEHALTMDAAAAYQALRGLKEELQRCFLLQNAALSANARRGSLKRRTGDMPDPVSPSPRTSIIRGSLLIVPNNNRYQPITVATLISESEGLQAQMLSTLLPHNMAVAELMVRLLAFRDGLLTQSRQYKSLGRREIYKFLKKFGFAIEQQLDLDVHAQNMEVSSQAKPIATQIASALEELDKVEQEATAKATSSSSAPATASSAPPSLAPTTPANLAQQNPVLANKLQQQQSLASGSNHTNQTNAGRFCLDRMRTLVVHADEVLYRMRLMKETLLSLAANDSESESEYEDDDTIDDERLDERDDLSVTYSVGGVSQFSGGTGFTSRTRATAAAGGMTPHGNPTTPGAKPLSNRMRRTRDKEALERAMHDMVMNRDELKKKVTAMMTSTMSEDVDVLIKSNVTTEESLANKLFDATFRKDDASVAVLLLRSHNVAVLRSIYATWPGLVFDIALTEPVVMPSAVLSSTAAGNGSVPLRPGHQYSSGSPLVTRSASLNMSNGMPRGGGALSLTSLGGGPTPSSVSNHPMLHGMMRSTGSPLRGGTSVAGSHHPGIAGMMSPAAGGVGHRPGVAVNLRSSFDHESEAGGSFSSHQQGLRGLSSPSKNVMMGSGGGGGSMPLPGSCSVEIVYQKHWSKDIDTLVVDFSDTRLLRNLGFKLIQLRDSRMYSWTDLLNAGYPLAEIKPLRVSAAASSAQGGSGSSAVGSNIASTSNMGNGIPSSYNDPSDPLGKLTSGFKLSVDELRTAGYSIEQCLQAGFDATALRAGGFNELQLVQSGLFTMKQLKKAGCDVQRFALKALFEATNGKHWRRRDGWCSNLPLSEWFGVKLDGAGNVVRIDLRSNELSGRLPEALYLLSHLEYLDLSNNNIAGSLPHEFRKLTKLRDLWLDRNGFSNHSMRKADIQVLLPQCRIRL